MDNITSAFNQIRAVSSRNEARLALGEAAYAAATVRRLSVYAMSIMEGELTGSMTADIAAMRRALADASAALDKMEPVAPAFREAAE